MVATLLRLSHSGARCLMVYFNPWDGVEFREATAVGVSFCLLLPRRTSLVSHAAETLWKASQAQPPLALCPILSCGSQLS